MKRIALTIIAAAAAGLAVWLMVKSPATGESAKTGDPPSNTKSTLNQAAPGAPAATPAKKPAPGKSNTTPEPGAEDLKGKVLVNLGKVEDIGTRMAVVMASQGELAALKAVLEADRTPEQKRRLLELERQHAAAMGTLEEIEGFQDKPDEYARFFGSFLGKAANLNETQTAAVSDYMRNRSEGMIAAKLNAANEPTDATQEEAWEERRDAFNAETAAGAAKLLPPGEAERIGFNSGFLELMERDFDKAK